MFGCATAAGTSAADFFPWVQRLANAFGSPNLLYRQPSLRLASERELRSIPTALSMPQPDYEHARCILLWGYNPQASQPTDAMRISRAKARGAQLIVIDPRKASVVDKADLLASGAPGERRCPGPGHDPRPASKRRSMTRRFVRDWTNGPFLVREDTQQLLTEQRPRPCWTPRDLRCLG